MLFSLVSPKFLKEVPEPLGLLNPLMKNISIITRAVQGFKIDGAQYFQTREIVANLPSPQYLTTMEQSPKNRNTTPVNAILKIIYTILGMAFYEPG